MPIWFCPRPLLSSKGCSFQTLLCLSERWKKLSTTSKENGLSQTMIGYKMVITSNSHNTSNRKRNPESSIFVWWLQYIPVQMLSCSQRNWWTCRSNRNNGFHIQRSDCRFWLVKIWTPLDWFELSNIDIKFVCYPHCWHLKTVGSTKTPFANCASSAQSSILSIWLNDPELGELGSGTCWQETPVSLINPARQIKKSNKTAVWGQFMLVQITHCHTRFADFPCI